MLPMEHMDGESIEEDENDHLLFLRASTCKLAPAAYRIYVDSILNRAMSLRLVGPNMCVPRGLLLQVGQNGG